MDLIVTQDLTITNINDVYRSHINTRENNIHSYFEDFSREIGCRGEREIVKLIESHITTSDVNMILNKVANDYSNNQNLDLGILGTALYIDNMINGPFFGSRKIGL